MVRSFLGRLVRIGTEPRIDVCREVQEREDTVVHAREGGEMTAPTPALPDALGQQHRRQHGQLQVAQVIRPAMLTS